ncbi:hypothetical protein ACL9RF_01615 [Sphingobacterium sp. Mn56C]|uniref:hypothetical protein n=1 Tax=Sphingobacterium sp. Mn56C TaxID=3395261 RepID=UPI003BC91C92
MDKENGIKEKISIQNGSITSLSEYALKSGIYIITAEKKSDIITYSTKVAKTVILNAEKIDFSNFVFTLDKGELKLDNYSLSLKNDELYLMTPLYEGFMKDGENNNLIDTKTAALMLLYSEISKNSNVQHKFTYTEFLAKSSADYNIEQKSSVKKGDKLALFNNRQCGLNHAVEFGWSKESAAADLAEQLSDTDFYNGCTKVGGISTSCITDEHACMSSQTYRCPC